MQECFNRYYLSKQIANKPSGPVYLAHHISDGSREVVVEVFEAGSIPQDQQGENFLQKVEKIKQLRHSSIVPILDIGIEQGQPYVVRERLTSDSLRYRLDYLSPQRLSLQEALTIIFQVGQVLCYAHQHEIVHGNIKPETIFFNSNGEVLLSDFGLASFLDMTKLSQKSDLQTISYLAPEQFVGSITEKSDQYALACLAYELMTGRLPFSSPSCLSVVPLTATNEASGKAIKRKEKANMDLAVLVQAGSFCENSQCPDYGQTDKNNVRKYGKTSKGEQRWQCKTCQATWSFSLMWAKDHPELLIPPSDLVPNLPESIEEAVLKAIAKDPLQRYADISLFLRVLQRALPLVSSVFSIPPIVPSFNTHVTLDPLENMESEIPLTIWQSEVPLATRLPERSEHVHNEHSNRKTFVPSIRDTFPQTRLPRSRGKPVPPTLWLAFALSGIVLLVGTLILYALVPSHSPGSLNPVKKSLTIPIVPTAAHLVPSVVPTTPQPSPQVHATPLTQLAQQPIATTLNGSFAEQNGDAHIPQFGKWFSSILIKRSNYRILYLICTY